MNTAPTSYVDLRQVDLNLLRVFDAIATQRSLSRAAERLGLTQPGLSRALARLRSEFGDQLFVKARGALVLTPRAESAAACVREALSLVERALTEHREFEPAAASRTFTIAATDYYEAMLLGHVAARLQADAPGVSLHSLPTLASDPAALQCGTVDLAIGARPSALPGIHARKLLTDRYACIGRRGHPALRNGELSLQDFRAHKHVAVAAYGQAESPVDEMLALRGFKREAALRIHSFMAAPELVAGSDLIATLPEQLAMRLSRVYPICVARAPIELGSYELCLSWHERLHRDLGHTWFRQLLIDVAAQVLGERRARTLSMVVPKAG